MLVHNNMVWIDNIFVISINVTRNFSFTSAAGNNYRTRCCKCWISLYTHIHILHVCNALVLYQPSKSRGPATLPGNPTDLRAAGATLIEAPSEQALGKPGIALLRKGFRTYVHCDEDLWIYFLYSRLLKSSSQ